jgi:hydrogenase maturation protease
MRSAAIESPVLVIGYGNELCGDDGAGPIAAEMLRDLLPDGAEVLTFHQLLPELIMQLSKSKLAIFIDADCQTPAGQVRREYLSPDSDGEKAIGHHQSPEGLLNMARELCGHAPPAILFRIGAADFRFHQGLSKPVRLAVRKLVEQVVELVEQATQESHYA